MAASGVDSGIAGRHEVSLRIEQVSKGFPGVQALAEVSFSVHAGTVHGLVGENGAGKSTLLKLISGADIPDQGRLLLSGEELPCGDPRAVLEAGVAIIYQEVNLVRHISVAENVMLGRIPAKFGLVRWAALRKDVARVASDLGLQIDVSQTCEELSVSQQRVVEILRALTAEAQVVLMDEPTAALGARERQGLYEVIRALRATGRTVVLVSHDLPEVLHLCDEVTVMRNGRHVATAPVTQWTEERLVEAMLGHAVERADRRPPAVAPEDPLLTVEELSIPGTVADVAFTLHAGEILGIAGLVGSGRTEILRAIAGADRPQTGRMTLSGSRVPWPRSVRRALRYGIVLAPEERKSQGLVLGLPAETNAVITDLRAATGRIIRPKRIRSAATRAATPLGFEGTLLGREMGTFSGGNQQKIVLAKCLHRRPRVLLLDEPTRGIDIGARAEISERIVDIAQTGVGVLVVSSEFDELVELCQRIIVLRSGRVVGELTGEDRSTNAILERVFGIPAALEAIL